MPKHIDANFAYGRKLKEDFPVRLKNLRKMRKISQKDFAKKLGITAQTYNRYERNNAQPSIDLLVHIACLLEVSLDELVGFDPFPQCQNFNKSALEYAIKVLETEMETLSK